MSQGGEAPGEKAAIGLASRLHELAGVGPARARALAAAGLTTVRDLLLRAPFRWEDRIRVRPIAEVGAPGEPITVHGRVSGLKERRVWPRRMRIVEAVIDDGSGALPVVWFNQPYLARSLPDGASVWLHGTLRPARRGAALQLVNPEWEADDEDDEEPLHVGRIVPIYRSIKGWSGRRLRALAARVLAALGPIGDPLTEWLPADLALAPLGRALAEVHFPTPPAGDHEAGELLAALAERRTAAQRRLAFEELLALAATLEAARRRRRRQRAVAVAVTDAMRERARAVLPFTLTAAQRRVLAEVVADLRRAFPMARLLQGDVGSGKTIVATLAALLVLDSGAQVAVLAPTELLAQQHHATLSAWLARVGHRPELLLGSLPAAEKRRIRAELGAGAVRLVIGTHALLEETVAFHRLGLAIVDEQHRFGAAQRQALLAKGEAPHLLVMTATPIPRSLALSLYGDLDVSLLDELPPGRTPVKTVLRHEGARGKLLEFVAKEAASGGQVYWVFPVIEESESLDVRAVTSHAAEIAAALPGATVGVVHGRLSAAEREEAMRGFAAGGIRVLCATTVIEVGVDVPDATLMVIENAERFGVAQLHQLRGRVGRGTRRSLCVLLAASRCGDEARRRLELVASTTDGFRIAEEDFRARGPGELTGLRQWGRPELSAASLLIHRRELDAARMIAAAAADAGQLGSLCGALRIEVPAIAPA